MDRLMVGTKNPGCCREVSVSGGSFLYNVINKSVQS